MFAFATTNYLTTSSTVIENVSSNVTELKSSSDINESDIVDERLGWLPLAAIMFVAIGYHVGLSPITWSYTGNKISANQI